MAEIRIAIVDDNEELRATLSAFLQREQDMQVVAEVGNGLDAPASPFYSQACDPVPGLSPARPIFRLRDAHSFSSPPSCSCAISRYSGQVRINSSWVPTP